MSNEKPDLAHPLTDVVDNIVITLLPKATLNKSFFVNDIPERFRLGRNSEAIASVIGSLLSAVVSYAKDSCIWLSAQLHGNVILVHVKSSNGFNSPGIEQQIRRLQLIAGRNRGTVGLTAFQNHVTSLTYGFTN